MKFYILQDLNSRLPRQEREYGYTKENEKNRWSAFCNVKKMTNNYLVNKYKKSLEDIYIDFGIQKKDYLRLINVDKTIRIDDETKKIFYPYSRIEFSFNKNIKADEQAIVECNIEYYQHILKDIDSFDFYEESSNRDEFIKSIKLEDERLNTNTYKTNFDGIKKSCKANFGFYFTSYEKDIECFTPFIEIFMDMLHMDRERIIGEITQEVKKSLLTNKKGNKRLVNEELLFKNIENLKKKYTNNIIESIQPELGANKKLVISWSLPISRSVANALIEYFYTEVIKNFTVNEDKKKTI